MTVSFLKKPQLSRIPRGLGSPLAGLTTVAVFLLEVGTMQEVDYKANVRWCEELLCNAAMNKAFLSGYLQGLRRHYHGEQFSTPEEHEVWLSLADSPDEERRSLGQGYRHGFSGAPLSMLPDWTKTERPGPALRLVRAMNLELGGLQNV